jgi:hypothetical protein
LIHFPFHRSFFINFENIVNKYAYNVLKIYKEKFVEKINTNIPYYMKKIMYILHGNYIKTKDKTNFTKIMLYFLEIDEKFLLFMLLHHQKYEYELSKINYYKHVIYKSYERFLADSNVVIVLSTSDCVCRMVNYLSIET